jgi:hypothetical protein
LFAELNTLTDDVIGQCEKRLQLNSQINTLLVNDAKLPATGDGLSASLDTHLRIDITQVPLHSAFRDKQVTPRMIRKIPLQSQRKTELLLQSLPMLQEVGRNDLVRAIRLRAWKFRLLRG